MTQLDDLLSSGDWTGKAASPNAPASGPAAGSLDDLLSRSDWGTQEEKKPPVTANTPWSDVLSQGAQNLGPDVIHTGEDIATGIGRTIAHPIDTAGAIGSLAKGTYDYFKGNDTPERQAATNLGKQLQHDYLTEEGWKQAIAERPFSRALDVGTAMVAPEFGAEKLGATGLAKAINMANPSTWVEKAVAKAADIPSTITEHLIGEAGTHTGGYSLALGRQAGKRGMGSIYLGGLKSKATIDDMVGGFEQAADDVKNAGHTEYRADKNALKSDNQRLSFDPVDAAIAKAEQDFIGPFSVNPNPDVVRAIGEAKNLVANQKQVAQDFDVAQNIARFRVHPGGWHIPGPNPYIDPLGMDELKKALGRITASNSGEAKAAAARIQQAMADHIKAEAPIYDKMMNKYNVMSTALQSYKSELGLGKSPDVALKKLFAGLRGNNVASSFWRKRDLMEELAKNPKAEKSLYALAGQYNSAWFPRGLMGQIKTGAAPFALAAEYSHAIAHPLIAAMIAGSQSPRLMGTMAVRQGQLERIIGKMPWRSIAGPMAHYGSMPPWSDVNPALSKAESIQSPWYTRYTSPFTG